MTIHYGQAGPPERVPFPVYDWGENDPERQELYDQSRRSNASLTALREEARKVEAGLRLRRRHYPHLVEKFERRLQGVNDDIAAEQARHDEIDARLRELSIAAEERVFAEFDRAFEILKRTWPLTVQWEDGYSCRATRSGRDGLGFELELFDESGERVFGYSTTIHSPRMMLRYEDDTVEGARVSWGSYSGMTTVKDAERAHAVHSLAIDIATVINDIFGLRHDGPTELK